MFKSFKLVGIAVLALLALRASAQIGGTGWKTATVKFNIQKPYNTNQDLRYWFTNNIYHCLVYSNDEPFSSGSGTLPRTEQRFTPDYTNGEIQYQAVMMCPGNENSFCCFQIHSGDAQSPTYGSTTFMLFWFSKDGGSVHDYSGTELAKNLGDKWFQLNVDHNVATRTIRVWVNQSLVWTQEDNGAGDFYMKDGVYEQNHSPSYQMDTYISNSAASIKMWVSSGTNPPSAPIGLTATPMTSQIKLVWNSFSAVGVTNYNVKRSTTNGGPYTIIAALTGTNYTDAGITIGPTYYYVVSAVDQFGESTNSSQASASLFDPGYQLSVTPLTQSVAAGNSTNYTVTMSTDGNFSGSVTLGAGGLPSGAGANFNPATLSVSGNSTLTVQTTTNTPGGSYVLTIGGTNGSSLLTTNVTLVISGAVANPGTLLWTAGSGAGTNWSVSRNWTNLTSGGYGPPGISNSVGFTNAGTVSTQGAVNNNLDASVAILSLTYSQTTNCHTTQISAGNTLTIATNLAVGTSTELGTNGQVTASITGAGGTLAITNASGVVNIRLGTTNSIGAWAQRATLDLSGLDNFNAATGRLLLAADGGANQREVGTLLLAKTNNLTLNGGVFALDVSENPSYGAGANTDPTPLASYLELGLDNSIYADTVAVGRSKGAGQFIFNPAFTNAGPTLFLRGVTNSRVSLLAVGDESALGNSNQRNLGTADLSGGSVDAQVDVAYVGRSMNGNNSGTAAGATGVLTFSDGTLDVNTLEVGYQTLATGTGPGSSGTVNVNGDGLLQINQTLELAHGNASVPLEQGTLNVNGGTVQATNLVGGGGISMINLNSGTMDLQGSGQIAKISTLNIGANGVDDSALLANAAIITVSNAIVIAANGTLTGDTIITSPGLTVNGLLVPGELGIGAITNNGPTTLGAGGILSVTVQDACGTPAAGWDFLKANGTLNLQAGGGNPFTIQVQSFDPAGSGLVTNFNYNTNYDWPVATASGGIANFNANDFAVDNSQFANDLAGGCFYVRQSGNSLVLSFTNNHPPAANVTWLYRTGNTMAIPIASLTNQWSDPDGDAVQLLGVDNSTNGAALGSDADFIYYTNGNNVADEVSYTVEDIRNTPPAIYQPGDTQQTGAGEIILLPPPATSNVRASGNNLVMSGAGGKPNGTYYVLGTTNLALPLTNWTILSTNSFDGSGNFNLTNPMDAGWPQWFYLMQSQ